MLDCKKGKATSTIVSVKSTPPGQKQFVTNTNTDYLEKEPHTQQHNRKKEGKISSGCMYEATDIEEQPKNRRARVGGVRWTLLTKQDRTGSRGLFLLVATRRRTEMPGCIHG